jgi:hypothetical protein
MSEQNILNPTAASQLNPTYTIPHKDPAIISSWQPRSGKPFSRTMMARGMEFQLHWDKVPFSTYQALRQWFRQYEQDFFSYFDIDDNRYYSGQFLAEPQYERVANNQCNISATFVVCPTLPQFVYPSNWGVDSIFLEERNGFGADLVKLTGTWDHRDKNYLQFSEQLDNAVWTKANLGSANPIVTANATADPNGNLTAESIAFAAAAGGNFSDLRQSIPNLACAGLQFTFSIWLKVASGTGSIDLNIQDGAFATFAFFVNVNITTAWQRFTATGVFPNNAVPGVNVVLRNPGNNTTAITVFAWGAQLEYGPAATSYVQTTAVPLVLLAPNTNANYHGGSAYFNLGTGSFVTDFAEWLYVGYGFRVWAYKGPDMGFLPIALDGVVLATVDLYSATPTASSVVFTQQNIPLGQHRVKIGAINQKNAASSAFFISADAIEVMR